MRVVDKNINTPYVYVNRKTCQLCARVNLSTWIHPDYVVDHMREV
jgi:hypothetical protein